MKTNMKAGRGYIIRFYDEKKDIATYLGNRGTETSPRLVLTLGDAKIFFTDVEAMTHLVKITPIISKQHNKGYLYISKIFYKTIPVRSRWIASIIPTKLTKPDRHDFLNSI